MSTLSNNVDTVKIMSIMFNSVLKELDLNIIVSTLTGGLLMTFLTFKHMIWITKDENT